MKINRFTISIVEAVYVIYMLNYFKTKYSLAHPLSNMSSDYFNHPIGVHKKPISNICKFGHDGSFILAIYLVLRGYLYENKSVNKKKLLMFNKMVILAVFLFSLMNFNAVVYLLPIFIIEIYLFSN